MEKKISCCGMICSDCDIYECCINQRRYEHCGQCEELPAAYVQKIHIVQAAIRENVQIKTGEKTENVHWKRESVIVMSVMKIAKKVY